MITFVAVALVTPYLWLRYLVGTLLCAVAGRRLRSFSVTGGDWVSRRM